MEHHLDVGLWSLFEPCLDLLQREYAVNDALQVRVLLDQIRFRHVVQVVQDAGEVQVSPGQLNGNGLTIRECGERGNKCEIVIAHTLPSAKCP